MAIPAALSAGSLPHATAGRARDYPEHMADIFDVIADGTRRDILRLLLDRESESDSCTSVSQIVS